MIKLYRDIFQPPLPPSPRPPLEDPLQGHARRILQGQCDKPEELLKLAGELKKQRDFSTARRILARARKTPGGKRALRLKLAQQHALCTYKDPELPADQRLSRALEILTVNDLEDLGQTKDQETLGLAGAIHKRRWEVFGVRQHLERSLAYYMRGYDQGVAQDFGYTGINAAYVLDLLAHDEETEAATAGIKSAAAAQRRERAAEIRRDIVSQLIPLAADPGKQWVNGEWWFLVTVAEALFGLKRFDEAKDWLARARALPDIADWEFESTARQLARLAQLEAKEDTDWTKFPGAQVLQEFLGGSVARLDSAFIGKVGLALSGGGFRASLFHIGVLARLAELDVLRRVEVLSCVSGGSIVGAHYYLEVRHLLQTKSDDEIVQQDYIDIVRRIEREFLAGVQENIRMRVFGNLLANLKMIFAPYYSRTLRLGELYERQLYSRVPDRETEPRWFGNLFVHPKGEDERFQPKVDNWKRAHKVPILILNATTLNTAHNWQFTASWMGEPLTGIDTKVDGADRLRRMYYWEAPEPYRNIRLGHAVAASSCVPALFEPLALDGLYPDRIVRLVDGGVYDNQGTAGLIGEDCTTLVVSDASGQVASEDKPSAGSLAVPLRVNGILMSRVRGAEYRDLDSRRRSLLLRGLAFLHLKKGLDVEPVDWVDCPDPHEASEDYEETRPARTRGPLTGYGMAKKVQEKLAGVRTDLDSFSEMEAFSLMLSGYRMMTREFEEELGHIPVNETKVPWRFLDIEKLLDNDAGFEREHERLMKCLSVGSRIGLKVWHLVPWLKAFGTALIFIAAVAALVAVWNWWSAKLSTPTVGQFVTWLVAFVVALTLPTIYKIIYYRESTSRTLLNVGAAIVGCMVVWIHIKFFDRLFLNYGRVKNPGKDVPQQRG